MLIPEISLHRGRNNHIKKRFALNEANKTFKEILALKWIIIF